jgi:hypothetical protein
MTQGVKKPSFSSAVNCAPGDRVAFLEKACAGRPELRQRIEQFLKAQPRLGEFMENLAGFDRFNDLETVGLIVPPKEMSGTRIGHYKLLQKICEGGAEWCSWQSRRSR